MYPADFSNDSILHRQRNSSQDKLNSQRFCLTHFLTENMTAADLKKGRTDIHKDIEK